MTKNENGERAEALLDTTMNYFLNSYGLELCLKKFVTGREDIPRGDTKVRPDSFVMDYIRTLGIVEDTVGGKDKRDRPPPSQRPTKKRALIMFSGDGKGAWDTPLFETIPTPVESYGNRVKQASSTKITDDTTTGNDTIMTLNEEL